MENENEMSESCEKPRYQLFDYLPEDKFQALKEDIGDNGVQNPVVLDENGEILDGHNRVRAWTELKQEGVDVPDYPTVVLTGMTEDQKRQYVRKSNILRRNLTPKELRECIADQLKETPLLSDRMIAKAIGVSPTTVGKVRAELEACGELSAVDSSIGADKKIRTRNRTKKNPDPSESECVAITDADVAESVPEYDPDFKNGHYSDVLNDMPSESVSLIITHPPFLADEQDQWEKFGGFAAEKLRRGGFLLAYCPQDHLPMAINGLSRKIQYVWEISASRPSTDAWHGHIDSRWEPVLVFCKPPYDESARFCDIHLVEEPKVKSPDREWYPGEAKDLIEMFSRVGDCVVDPFVSSGDSIYSAFVAGRRFIGCNAVEAVLAKAMKQYERIKGQMELPR